MFRSNLTAAQKRRWVADLRSGKFKQAIGELCGLDDWGVPRGYCCLGVLAATLGHKTDAIVGNANLDDVDEKILGAFGPDNVVEFNADNKLTHNTLQRRLAGMNDRTGGTSFKRIATWIEKNVATKGRKSVVPA